MRDTSKGGQTFGIAPLVAIVDCPARKNPIAVVFVRVNRANAYIGRAERRAAIDRLRKKSVGHIAEARRVIASVVKRDIDVAGDGINSHPVIEAVHELRELIGCGVRGSPSESAIVGGGYQNVSHSGGREIHPGAV